MFYIYDIYSKCSLFKGSRSKVIEPSLEYLSSLWTQKSLQLCLLCSEVWYMLIIHFLKYRLFKLHFQRLYFLLCRTWKSWKINICCNSVRVSIGTLRQAFKRKPIQVFATAQPYVVIGSFAYLIQTLAWVGGPRFKYENH